MRKIKTTNAIINPDIIEACMGVKPKMFLSAFLSFNGFELIFSRRDWLKSGLDLILGVLFVLFLLRFIWTFNKFDDIFLLTGGAAGTKTLTVDVYETGFNIGNLGTGAANAVLVFLILVFAAIFIIRFSPKE